MKPSKNSKKKKRSRNPRQSNAANGSVGEAKKDEQSMAMACLTEAFSSISMERVAQAYEDAGGDSNRAAEVLGSLLESLSYTDPSSSSSSGWSSSERGFDFSGASSTSSERLSEEDVMQLHVRGKERKSVASMGTVAGVIGKDYMKTTNKRSDQSVTKSCNSPALKGVREAPDHNEEVEQFIWSLFGEDCELSMEVVRDVLGQCGYNVEKALDALFDLSVPSSDQFKDGNWSHHAKNCENDSRTFHDHADSIHGRRGKSQLAGRTSDSTLHLSEQELPQFWPSSTHDFSTTAIEQGLSRKVLESLFNVPERSEHEVVNMNWKDIVNKMDSFGERIDLHPPTVAAKLQQSTNCGKNADYQSIRKVATERYDAMKSCYQRAAAAYARGERGYAAYLSEQGRIQNKTAKKADERASLEIFRARNQGIHNIVTIDLHGQHVQQAIKILKAHLLMFSTYTFSVRSLRVITGCGHGVAAGKVKQSVIALLKKECIEWTEENLGSVLIKIDGRRNFSFMDTDQDLVR
ncbi:hypothetical protein Sjap_014097 [Stephania japonica]|uniref:Smr domain-containing protein n=1 Tax=Stephania japonica TaxID=461633 RepID=A0AAP0P0M0_9MAGN